MRRWGLALVLGLALGASVAAAVVARRVTVTTTATAIAANTVGQPIDVALVNRCTASVVLGGAGVTAADGLELAAGAGLAIVLGPAETLYGIVAADTCRVDVLLTRQ